MDSAMYPLSMEKLNNITLELANIRGLLVFVSSKRDDILECTDAANDKGILLTGMKQSLEFANLKTKAILDTL